MKEIYKAFIKAEREQNKLINKLREALPVHFCVECCTYFLDGEEADEFEEKNGIKLEDHYE